MSLGLEVLRVETWPDGTRITWLESPFPYERKPQFPSRVFSERAARQTVVPLSALIGTQREVTDIGVVMYAAGATNDLPMVYRDARGLFIADGHHRLTAAFLRGETEARVRLVDLR